MSLCQNQKFAARFLASSILFALPLGGLLLFGEIVLWRTGENWLVTRALAEQANEAESIYERALFSQQFNLYKMEALRRRRPTVVALGSSRVMVFRQFMFAPLTFYNAGGLLQSAADVDAYVNLVAAGDLPLPHTAIVGLDWWWFFKGRVDTSWLRPDHDQSRDDAFGWAAHLRALRYVFRDSAFPWPIALGNAARLSPVYGYPALGIAALRSGDGERGSDGSHLFAQELLEFAKSGVYRDREDPPVLLRARLGLPPQFPFNGVIDRQRVAGVVSALVKLKQLGTEVLVVLPPVSDEVWDELGSSERLRSWWSDYSSLLPSELSKGGIACIGPTHPFAVGLDDRTMFDGFHAGERLMVELVIALLAKSSTNGTLAGVDRQALEALRRSTPEQALSYQPPRLRLPGS